MPAPTVTLTSRATRSHFRISRIKPSFVKRYSGPRTFYCNASSISRSYRTKSLGIDFRQGTRVRRGHPQSQQVAFALRLRKVFERGSVVQNGMVVHELNITGLQFHREVSRWVVRQLIEQIQYL